MNLNDSELPQKEWFTEATGIDCNVEIKLVSPIQYLLFYTRNNIELLRVPLKQVRTKDTLLQQIPEKLNNDEVSLSLRIKLLVLLSTEPNELEKLNLLLPTFRTAADATIADSQVLKFTSNKIKPALLFAEAIRQIQKIVFAVDDISAQNGLELLVTKK